MRFGRSLPLETALHPDTILAYEMNGAPLTPEHGYPVRLIAPGWYAMASVKWLTRITVLDEPFEGFFQRRRYVLISEGETGRQSPRPITKLRVKSIINRPRHGEVVHPGLYTIHGKAWSGDGEIVAGGGQHERRARLAGRPDWWGRRRAERGVSGSFRGRSQRPATTS